jgi:quinoprotein dehydrogenase-associated probable ABC transporter substrate-binding protein
MKAFTKRGAMTLAIGALLLSAGYAEAGGKAFKVCADPNNPPFSVKDGSGYENKIAELFASELGQTLEYTWFPQRLGFIRNTLKAKLPDSEEYKCDVVMGVPTGFEMAATTNPYYRSTYVLVYKKSGPLQGIKAPSDIDKLAPETKAKLRIAMFDGAPGTTWLLNHGLIGQGIPYQSMTGDVTQNTAQILARDFSEDKIDMVVIWGPMAGYLATSSPDTFELIPMKSEPGLKFEFPMSMGVRRPDKERKQMLDDLIAKNGEKIKAILESYKVPLVEASEAKDIKKDDD